jgi:hypothetical protein
LVSAEVRMEDTGEVIDVHGPNPRGRAIIEAGGHVMFLITPSDRKSPRDAGDAAALFRTMTSYAGRYRVEGNEIVTQVEVAWHPDWEDSEQRRFFAVAGDKLTLTTAVGEHPSYPGRSHRGSFTWERER